MTGCQKADGLIYHERLVQPDAMQHCSERMWSNETNVKLIHVKIKCEINSFVSFHFNHSKVNRTVMLTRTAKLDIFKLSIVCLENTLLCSCYFYAFVIFARF